VEKCIICGDESAKIREFLVNKTGECDPLCDKHYIEIIEMLLDECKGHDDSKKSGGLLSRFHYNPKRLQIVIRDAESAQKIRRHR
jgi:hypothetical protein